VAAENGNLDEVPARMFEKLPLSAKLVDGLFAAGVARVAKADDQHLIFGDALAVEVDNVVLLLDGSAADAIRVFQRNVVAIAALRGVHAAILSRLYRQAVR
jgi:hypothetical protein